MANGVPQGGRSLDAHKLEAAYTSFRARFFKDLQTAPTIYERISDSFESDAPVNVNNWITEVPKMRKWIGNKRLNKLRAEKHEIRTEPYESSIEVPKQDILDDRLGMWATKIGDMGRAYPLALDDLVVDMYVAGFADTLGRTYDGQYLLDTDHTADGAGQGVAQSNIVTGALTPTVYRTAYKRLAWQFVDSAGESIRQVPAALVVGIANADVGRDILQRQWISNGAGGGDSVQVENLERGTVDLIVTPRITDTKWFLLAANPTAVVLQRKRGPDFYSVGEDGLRGGATNPHTFMTGKVLYGIEAEFGAAYGAWQDVVGGLGT